MRHNNEAHTPMCYAIFHAWLQEAWNMCRRWQLCGLLVVAFTLWHGWPEPLPPCYHHQTVCLSLEPCIIFVVRKSYIIKLALPRNLRPSKLLKLANFTCLLDIPSCICQCVSHDTCDVWTVTQRSARNIFQVNFRHVLGCLWTYINSHNFSKKFKARKTVFLLS